MTETADSNEHWVTAFLLNLDQQRNYPIVPQTPIAGT